MTGTVVNILLPILILFVFSVLTPTIDILSKKFHAKITPIWSSISFLLSLTFITRLYLMIYTKGSMIYEFYPPPIGIEIRADALSLFFSALFILLGFLATISSYRYMEKETGHGFYYTLLQLMVAGMVGLTFAWDFFTFYIFWEIMCLSSYVLVSFRIYDWEAVEAGFKYFIMSSFGSFTLLFSMSYLYGLTGTLNFSYLAEILSTQPITPLHYLALFLMIIGFSIKAAIVPLHTWLPDAHPAAPSPISAMLSGVVIKAGIYGLIRALFTFFIPFYYNYGIILLILGFATMTLPNLMAYFQKDLKRLLAYSSIVNIGFIITAVGVAAYTLSSGVSKALPVAALAITGALFHVFNHALAKGMLFLGSGNIFYRIHTREIEKIGGIGRDMPLTGYSMSVGLLSLLGMPPLNGFWSKLLIIWSAFLAFQAVGGAVTITTLIFLLFNVVFAVTYYLKVIKVLMIEKGVVKTHEAPFSMIFPVVALALICIIVGLFPIPFFELAELASSILLGGG